MAKDLTYNGVTFNTDHWRTKTESEFIKHESHTGLNTDQLKEAFALMNPKIKEAVKEKSK